MQQVESRVPSPESRPVSGILLLDKPLGLSSNQALQRVRRLFAAAKAGHTGSLDPLATGLLPICLGEATKIAGLLLGSRKAYLAEVQLGATTATDDGEGDVLERRPVPPLDAATLRTVLDGFVGRIQQTPPAYSALKQGGVPLYRRARRGENVEVAPREVEIESIEVLAQPADRLELRVTCGSGTYIRSLARDIGAHLGCGAHLSGLRRLWVEPFREPCMYSLEELQQHVETGGMAALDALLLPVDTGLAQLPEARLDHADSLALAQGRRVHAATRGLCRVYADDGRLLALAEGDSDGWLRVRRGFNLPPPG
jgi:tRNA pseudouridine55 synthase